MMGQQPRTDSLFYYFRLEDQIPSDHRLKRLDRFIDFGFVRERLRDTYSAVGRPSIDPEVLLRLLLSTQRSLNGEFPNVASVERVAYIIVRGAVSSAQVVR